MLPVVGYVGGKRRLLSIIRPHISIDTSTYFEPFVGMGAVYLDLRARGFTGPAFLADIHPFISSFWRLVHDAEHFEQLLVAADRLSPATSDAEYLERLTAPIPDDPCEAVAVFLWLTNYAFSNMAPIASGQTWRGAKGSKLKAAMPGRTFPWSACVDRLRKLNKLSRYSATVLDSAINCLGHSKGAVGELVYADPPYKGSSLDYGQAEIDFIAITASAKAPRVILSEKTKLVSDEWAAYDTSVTDRVRGTKAGAKGSRTELLFVRDTQ